MRCQRTALYGTQHQEIGRCLAAQRVDNSGNIMVCVYSCGQIGSVGSRFGKAGQKEFLRGQNRQQAVGTPIAFNMILLPVGLQQIAVVFPGPEKTGSARSQPGGIRTAVCLSFLRPDLRFFSHGFAADQIGFQFCFKAVFGHGPPLFLKHADDIGIVGDDRRQIQIDLVFCALIHSFIHPGNQQKRLLMGRCDAQPAQIRHALPSSVQPNGTDGNRPHTDNRLFRSMQQHIQKPFIRFFFVGGNHGRSAPVADGNRTVEGAFFQQPCHASIVFRPSLYDAIASIWGAHRDCLPKEHSSSAILPCRWAHSSRKTEPTKPAKNAGPRAESGEAALLVH